MQLTVFEGPDWPLILIFLELLDKFEFRFLSLLVPNVYVVDIF